MRRESELLGYFQFHFAREIQAVMQEVDSNSRSLDLRIQTSNSTVSCRIEDVVVAKIEVVVGVVRSASDIIAEISNHNNHNHTFELVTQLQVLRDHGQLSGVTVGATFAMTVRQILEGTEAPPCKVLNVNLNLIQMQTWIWMKVGKIAIKCFVEYPTIHSSMD